MLPRVVWLAAVCALTVGIVMPQSAASSLDACLTDKSPDTVQRCSVAAEALAADQKRLAGLGDQLEAATRFAEAEAVYEIATRHFPRDRTLLQGLIRARSQSRALDGIGDAVMRRSVATRPLKPVPDAEVTELSSIATAEHVGQPQTLVGKLELLDDLWERGLVAQDEYREQRAVVLESAFGPTSTQPEVPAISTTVRPEIFGRFLALIIGNQKYSDFEDLRTPIADAKAMAKILSSDYGFDTTLLLNAGRYEMARALSDLRRKADGYDNVLVYYAGHGYLDEVTKRGYWLPVDAEDESTANWIPTTDITDALAGVSSLHGLVVADSCFSGALGRSAGADAMADRSDLLQRLRTQRSRTVLTSGGLEPVADGGRYAGRNGHSVFAAALLQQLSDNDGVLEVGRLFVQLRDRVSSNAEQTPQYAPIRNAGHEGGDFLFVRRGNAQR